MRGVILHGGYGTKLRPLTYTLPKQLIPVANKPISQYVVENLKEAGIKDIAIVLGNIYQEKVREHYGSGQKFGVKFHYIQQKEPEGIAQAVGLCKDYVDNEPFVVYLGDNLIKDGIDQLVKRFEKSNCDVMLLLCEVKNPQRFGVAKFDNSGKLVKVLEKPKEPPSHYALTGIYFFKPVIFKAINKLKPSWRGELEITDAIQLMLESGYNVDYETVQGWWKDTGAPEEILEANRLVLEEVEPMIKGHVEKAESIQGRVTVCERSVIEEKALIRGPAIIGYDALIQKNVRIGPNTSIGNGCKIRKGEIENSIIMDNCTIDVDFRITDSLIAPHSNIVSREHRRNQKRFIIGERSSIEL
jgi:glucose-1-phosphate thymidylyltransferase